MKVIRMYREIAAIRGTNKLEKTRYNLQQQLFFTPKANHGVLGLFRSLSNHHPQFIRY